MNRREKEKSLPPGLVELIKEKGSRKKTGIFAIGLSLILGFGGWLLVKNFFEPKRPTLETSWPLAFKEEIKEEIPLKDENETNVVASVPQNIEAATPKLPPSPSFKKKLKNKTDSPSLEKPSSTFEVPPFPNLYEHLWRAKEHEEQGYYEEAIKEYLKFCNVKREANVLNRVALLYLKLGKLEESKRFLEETLSIDPHNRAVLLNLSVVNFKLGYSERAKELLEELLKSDPKNPKVLFNLALVYEMLGNFDETKRLYLQLQELGDPEGKKGLERLGIIN